MKKGTSSEEREQRIQEVLIEVIVTVGDSVNEHHVIFLLFY